MGLYEKLLEERAQEERRRGRTRGASYGSDSPVLDRRLPADAPEDRPPRYRRDLAMMHRFVTRGVRSQGGAYRLHALKRGTRRSTPSLRERPGGRGSFRRGKGAWVRRDSRPNNSSFAAPESADRADHHLHRATIELR